MPYSVYQQPAYDSFTEIIAEGEKLKFDMVAGPINPWEIPYEFEEEPLSSKQNDFTYPDLVLNANQWAQKFLTILSDGIDCDSDDPQIRKYSEKVLEKEMSWISHVQTYGFAMLTLKSKYNVNLARKISNDSKGHYLIKVPVFNSRLNQCQYRRDIDEDYLEEVQKEDSWHWWDSFRKATDFNPRFKVVLEFHESYVPNMNEIRRWLGEQIEAVILPKSLYIPNKCFYPVLPKHWKTVLRAFFNSKINIILSSGIGDAQSELRLDYLNELTKGANEKHTLNGYEDVLEVPLQPLYDNLDSYTYEVFENDPIKYKLYQLALEAALIDMVPEEEIESKLTIVMLLGGGRGPIARACLNAAEKTNRNIRLYIIEKNPNAIRTLQCMIKKLWSWKDVHLFSKDMREFNPPEKADILVSELLGSFGDNELSPECLDISLNLLKPNGISIPSKSISFINPLMSMKLLNSVRTYDNGRNVKVTRATDFSYVVLLRDVYHIDFPQPLFEFVHPNYEKPIDNSRYKIIKFKVSADCIMTGLGGYFEAVLYKDIIISNQVETHTQGMTSWFPMYFPICDPIQLKEGDTIEVHFWRCCSKEKVWYEWSLSKPTCTRIHNLNGESQSIKC